MKLKECIGLRKYEVFFWRYYFEDLDLDTALKKIGEIIPSSFKIEYITLRSKKKYRYIIEKDKVSKIYEHSRKEIKTRIKNLYKKMLEINKEYKCGSCTLIINKDAINLFIKYQGLPKGGVIVPKPYVKIKIYSDKYYFNKVPRKAYEDINKFIHELLKLGARPEKGFGYGSGYRVSNRIYERGFKIKWLPLRKKGIHEHPIGTWKYTLGEDENIIIKAYKTIIESLPENYKVSEILIETKENYVYHYTIKGDFDKELIDKIKNITNIQLWCDIKLEDRTIHKAIEYSLGKDLEEIAEDQVLRVNLYTDIYHYKDVNKKEYKKFNKIIKNLWKQKIIKKLEEIHTEYKEIQTKKEYNKHGLKTIRI